MIYQELLDLVNSHIFRPAVMDAVINEFIPPADAFRITDAFCPMKNVDKEELIALIKAGVFGKTNPVALGGEHQTIRMPTMQYREFAAGYWRESILFDEETLQRVRKPEKPDELWGQGLIGNALNVLDIRLNTLIEYLSAQIVANKGYSVAKAGVNYSYVTNVPNKYYIYVGASGSLPSGYIHVSWGADNASRLWSATTTATPLTDIREAIKEFERYGYAATEIWMTRAVAGYVEDCTTTGQTRTFVEATPALSNQMITAELLLMNIAGLKGLKPVVDTRRYLDETSFRAVAAINDTVLNVEVFSADEFAAGDKITLRKGSTGDEEDATIASVSVANRTITVTAGITYSYAIGDRLTNSKLFMPENQVWIRGNPVARANFANWVSTPSLVKAASYKNPIPGRYTWSYAKTDRPPYFVEVGAGIDGGPVVYSPGGWLVMRVA